MSISIYIAQTYNKRIIISVRNKESYSQNSNKFECLSLLIKCAIIAIV